MVEISVVLGTWNRLPKLKVMLDSTRRAIGEALSYEVICVDGGSTDGTLEYLRQQPDVKLIEHGELLGAIKAFHDGATAATGRYVVFSNDDLEYVGDSIAVAYRFMIDHPEIGIGLFYTDRGNQPLHVAEMPAHYADGTMTNVPYNGLVIFANWLGRKLQWWDLENARSYAGDCALVSRCLEAGWLVTAIPGTHVKEHLSEDELNRINSYLPEQQHGYHPDTQAYLRQWPRGPQLGNARQFDAPPEARALRILYAPIYEQYHLVQHQQKYGLRRALQRYGIVREVDYMADGADCILDTAAEFKPDVVFTQCHYPLPFTPEHAADLRRMFPAAKLVNWIGDVYNIADNERYGADYLRMLSYFDMQLVVNVSALASYDRAGIRAAYWQNAVEHAGVGIEPDANTPEFDVLFLGTAYNQERVELGKLLKSLPYEVGIFGGEWHNHDITAGANNTYDFRRGCQLYRNAKLTISIAETREPASAFVSNRLFQACAAGNVLVLQQHVPLLEERTGYKDGEHYIVWHDPVDLRQQIDYWLRSENERKRHRIAKAGTFFTLRHHSFERRVADLMRMLYDEPGNVPPGVDPRLIGPEYA